MAERQQALAAAILQDPDVESLSSFIGVDGNNVTLNSGRFLINLKPRDERVKQRYARSSAACSRKPRSVPGITLYMQPVQDLTLDNTVSRTQYQFTLESAGRGRAVDLDAEAGGGAAHRSRNSPMWSATWRTTAWRPTSPSIATARRASGVSVGTVDNALYDAFGQRIVSTIFTQSNQYRVIIEADPSPAELARLARLDLRALGRGRPGAAVGDRQGDARTSARC